MIYLAWLLWLIPFPSASQWGGLFGGDAAVSGVRALHCGHRGRHGTGCHLGWTTTGAERQKVGQTREHHCSGLCPLGKFSCLSFWKRSTVGSRQDRTHSIMFLEGAKCPCVAPFYNGKEHKYHFKCNPSCEGWDIVLHAWKLTFWQYSDASRANLSG